jgi:hypothetical protein
VPAVEKRTLLTTSATDIGNRSGEIKVLEPRIW